MTKLDRARAGGHHQLHSGFETGFPQGDGGSSRHKTLAAPLPGPLRADHFLELTIGLQGIEKAVWDNQVLDGLTGKIIQFLPAKVNVPDSRGGFGVYCEGATVRIRQPQILIVEGVPHDNN
jgi:hypothetical protein